MAWIYVCTFWEYDQMIALGFRLELLRGVGIDQLRKTCLESGVDHSTTLDCPTMAGSDRDAALAAVTHAIEARFISPQPGAEPGVLSDVDVQGLVDAYFARRRVVEDAARARPSDIVATAEHLGLKPYPTGNDEISWRAWCPGTKHHIEIQSSTELFYCGYCGANGGPGELEGFAAARSSQAARRLTERKPHGPQ